MEVSVGTIAPSPHTRMCGEDIIWRHCGKS